MTRGPLRVGTQALAIALLVGCSVVPLPMTQPELRDRVARDKVNMYRDQEPISGPISFEQAVARALKYNLDMRLKSMESALSAGLADVARYDMLPNLLVTAGYRNRSNDSGGTSINIETGAVSLAPSTSEQRFATTVAAEFSWNVLDFGVSYYRAKQQADQVLIAEERRRRVMQSILQDVRSAYWRAVGAQRLMRESKTLNERVRVALDRSREAEKQGLVPPREALNYQRLLLDAVALLTVRQQELALARNELAALMNVPPGESFTLVEADGPELRAVPTDLAALEETALLSRPELREEDYRARISALEARRQLLMLLPGLSFTAGGQYDSNDLLYNNTWAQSGLRVGLNLLKLLSLPSLQNAQGALAQTDEVRRMGLSMAVLTQVRVAVVRYQMALHDLKLAQESGHVDQRMVSFARAGLNTRADSELELIRAETRALNSTYQQYATYAAAQAAFGRIYSAIGFEVVPDNVASASVDDLAAKVAVFIAGIESSNFPAVAAKSQQLPALRVRVDAPAGETADTSQVAAAVAAALARNHIPALEVGAPGPVLRMQLVLQPPRDGVQRAEWSLSLLRSDGKATEDARYASTLPASTTARTLAAFGEAAAVANLATIDAWLRPEGKP